MKRLLTIVLAFALISCEDSASTKRQTEEFTSLAGEWAFESGDISGSFEIEEIDNVFYVVSGSFINTDGNTYDITESSEITDLDGFEFLSICLMHLPDSHPDNKYICLENGTFTNDYDLMTVRDWADSNGNRGEDIYFEVTR